MNKIKCENLYKDYKECKNKIDESLRLRTENHLENNPAINPPLLTEDINKRNEIAEYLINNCKEHLDISEEELHELRIDSVSN